MSRVHRNDAIDGLLHRFAGLDPLMRAHLERRLAVYGDLVSGLTRLTHDVEAPIAVVPGASPG